MNLKTFLQDKYVLYIVVFLTFTNMVGYLLVQDTEAILFTVIIGYIATYFSKNMIVVLLVALLTTNFLIGVRVFKNGSGNKYTIEGMATSSNARRRATPPSPPVPADEELKLSKATRSKPRVDKDATIEAAYNNISKILNTDAVNSMTSDTSDLFDKQTKLVDSLEKMEPLMQRAGALMEKFDIEKMSNMAATFGGLASKFGESAANLNN